MSRKGGLLFGVIVGTLVGVLFAPKKGKDLRTQLKTEMEKGGMGTETIKKGFVEMGQDIGHTAEVIYQKPEVQKQVKKGKKYVDRFLKDSLKYVDKAQEEMKKIGKKYGVSGKNIEEARKHIEGGIQMVKKRIMGEGKAGDHAKKTVKAKKAGKGQKKGKQAGGVKKAAGAKKKIKQQKSR